MKIVNAILIFLGIKKKQISAAVTGQYVPYYKLPKVMQFKINQELKLTQDRIRHARRNGNMDAFRNKLLTGLEHGFTYDVKDFVKKNNVMPDARAMLSNYQTIPGFMSTFANAGITSNDMILLLKQVTGNR
ncbi:MAG: hypothetical protein PHW28_06800 [Mesotoga sp.]|nr:hypothetical protein [Mesotoga sp.]